MRGNSPRMSAYRRNRERPLDEDDLAVSLRGAPLSPVPFHELDPPRDAADELVGNGGRVAGDFFHRQPFAPEHNP